MRYLNLPGIGGSGPKHWQTYWEIQDPHFKRIQVEDWDRPEIHEWTNALDALVHEEDSPCVLVAHSLACLLVASYMCKKPDLVIGAFLVAVPDPQAGPFPREKAHQFVGCGQGKFSCPALLVASTDDPYGSEVYAKERASEWETGFISIGTRQHINDLGDWVEGRRLLEAFSAGLKGCS